MPNRSTTRRRLGLSVLIALVAVSLFAYILLRRTATTEYTDDGRVNDIIETPSQGERAHNENYFGLGRLENQDYQGAIDKFISATELDPDNPDYYANLAIAYEKDGQHDNAIDQVTIALTFQPNSPKYLSWLANAHFSKEQWQDAAEAYDAAIRYGSTDHRTLSSAAQVYLETGALIKALGAIESAIVLHGDDPDYYRISGIIKYDFQRYEDAIEDFERAGKMNPGNPENDEWIQYASDALKRKDMPKEARRTKEYYQESDNSGQKKLDEIHRRMEELKEGFMDKHR